jgi:hypothetical protein
LWIKSSDTDLTDRRLLEAGPLGRDLYHRAQLWMAAPANLTGGHISRRALRSLDDFADILENRKPVTLEDLAGRLVGLELWRIEGDGFYDLRFEGLNPAALIEKKKAAGRASAAARAAKLGSADPRANAEQREQKREHHPEQGPEQVVNRTRTRSHIGTLSKREQLTGPSQLGRAGVTAEGQDGSGIQPAPSSLPSQSLPARRAQPTQPQTSQFAVGLRVRHEGHGAGVVRSVWNGVALIRFDDGQVIQIATANLEQVA